MKAPLTDTSQQAAPAPPAPADRSRSQQRPPAPRVPALRALVIAIPLIIINCYWMMASWGRAGYATGQSFPTVVSLYYNAIFSLVLLMVASALLGRLSPRWALSEGERLTIYLMLTVASSIAGHYMLEILWPMVAYS